MSEIIQMSRYSKIEERSKAIQFPKTLDNEENFETLQIRAEQHITEAKVLLYNYYVKHLKWEIENNNPSGIKIQPTNKNKMLIDDYDNISRWFGTIYKNKVIACARLCSTDAEGFLELERYSEAKSKLGFIFEKKSKLRLLELNREAISPKMRSSNQPCLLLLKSILKYCLLYKHSLITTTNIKEWINLYDQIFCSRLDELSFKYMDSDKIPVEIYFVESHEVEQMLYKIDTFLL